MSLSRAYKNVAEQIWLKFNNDYDLEKFFPSKTHQTSLFSGFGTQFSFWVLRVHRMCASSAHRFFPYSSRCQNYNIPWHRMLYQLLWLKLIRNFLIHVPQPTAIATAAYALTIAVYESNVTEMFVIVFRFMYFKYDFLSNRVSVSGVGSSAYTKCTGTRCSGRRRTMSLPKTVINIRKVFAWSS